MGVNNSERFVSQLLEYVGAKLSLNIYIFHILVASLWSLTFKHVLFVDVESDLFQWTKPVMVVVCSIVLALIINKVSSFYKSFTNNVLPK